MSVLRAAGYIRVSTTRQAEEGLSLGEQEAAIRKRAEDEGWELVDLFSDRGVSGRNGDRKGLAELIAALPSLDVVIVTKLDRLGRRAAGMLELFSKFDAGGVRLLPLGDPEFDTSTAMGRAMPKLMAVFAEIEAEQLGERVKRTAAHRAESGLHHGRAPYGYLSKGGELQPDPKRAPHVRRMFEMAAAGTSQRKIAQAFNAEGIKPTKADRWNQAAIGALLRNPTFKGLLSYNGKTIPGNHDAIVPPELWDRVAGLRAAGTRSRRGGPGRSPAGRHLFTRGLLRCGHCGSAMAPRTERREGREEYRCLGRADYGSDHCPQTPIPRAAIDPATFAYFREVGIDIEAMRTEVETAIRSNREGTAAQLKQAAADERGAAERLERVRRDYQDGKIEAEDWNEQRKALTAELENARAGLRQAQAHEAAVIEAEGALNDPQGEALKQLEDIRRAVADEIEDADTAGIDAVRSALSAMFEVFYVIRLDFPDDADWFPGELEAADRVRGAALASIQKAGGDPIPVDFEGGYRVVPLPREEILIGLDQALRPILRKGGLAGPNKEVPGLTR